MFVVGLVLGPCSHVWYKLLDNHLIGNGLRVVFKKIAADQILAGPIFCTIFLFGNILFV